MKKTTMMRIASTLLIAVLLTTCAIGATFAKYTTSANATATATVAKWSIEVNNGKIATNTPDVITFNLFESAYDLKPNGTVDTTAEADVKADGSLIAPGCGGSYDLVVENLSEVNATYAIAFSIANTSSIPLEFCLSNSENAEAWKTNIAELNVSSTAIAMGTGTDTVTIYWRWAFGDPAKNATDTALGIAGTAPTAIVTAAITVEQVD